MRCAPHRHDYRFVGILSPHYTIEECVKGYTIHAAQAAWREADTGSLTPGKCADIIILDRDIFAVDAYEIAETQVLLTLLGGREVWRADGVLS